MAKCKICISRNIIFFCIKNGYKYFSCNKCCCISIDPQPEIRELNRYYKTKFKYKINNQTKKRLQNQAKKVISKLKKFNSKGSTLLDIGAGYGFIGLEAKNQKMKCFSIEPSKELFNYLINNNIEAVNLSFDRFYETNNNCKFDFITASHVIEHVKKPDEFINKVSSLLNAGGIFYIETPNTDSRLFSTEKENYTFLTTPEHLNLFSINSLKLIIQKIKEIKIISVSSYSYPEHFVSVLKGFLTFNNNKSLIVEEKTKEKNLTALTFIKRIKYLFINKLIAFLFTPLLNVHNKGSILELYIKKNKTKCSI